MICIRIAHALAHRQVVKSMQVPAGSSVSDALTLAALEADFGGIDLANSPVGIFGRPVRRDQQLKDGDRIEIYRPLAEEPKLARRRRVAQKRP